MVSEFEMNISYGTRTVMDKTFGAYHSGWIGTDEPNGISSSVW